MRVDAISTVLLTLFCFCPGREARWSPFMDGRIVGGKVVPIEDFPHQVSLLSSTYAVCGGSIISKDFVLTAGHCGVISNLKVRAGTNFTYKGGSLHTVVQAIVHENYSVNYAPRNDIALLRVTPPFDWDDARRPVPLVPANRSVVGGQVGVVSGFGRVQEGGSVSRYLQAVSIPVVDRKNCSDIYTSMGFPAIKEDFICAGEPLGGKDSCQGDSGGPYTVNGQVAGIVSYGLGCARPKVPGVYTNVAYFRNWIAKNANV